MVDGGIDNDGHFVISQINVSLKFFHFSQKSFHVMDKDTLWLKSLSNEFLLLIEISLLLFPHLNFVENDSDIISWSTNSFLSVDDSSQVLDHLLVRNHVLLLNKAAEIVALFGHRLSSLHWLEWWRRFSFWVHVEFWNAWWRWQIKILLWSIWT